MENSVPVLKIQYYLFIPSSTRLQRSSDRRQRTSASVRQTVVNASRHKLPVNSRFTCWRPSYYLISPTSVIRCQRVMSLRSVLSHLYYSSDIRHPTFVIRCHHDFLFCFHLSMVSVPHAGPHVTTLFFTLSIHI